MKRNKALQIGMIALATLFGGASNAKTIAPISQSPVKSNEAVMPGKAARPDKEKRAVIPIRGNGIGGEDFIFPSIATSPIYSGRQQKAKHKNMNHVSKDTKRKHKLKSKRGR